MYPSNFSRPSYGSYAATVPNVPKSYTNKPAPPDDSGLRRAAFIAPGLVGLQLLVQNKPEATWGTLVVAFLGGLLLQDALTDSQALVATGFGLGVMINGSRAKATERLLGGALGMLVFALVE